MDQKHYEKRLLRLHGRLDALGAYGNEQKRLPVIASIARIYEQLEDDAEAIAWLLKQLELSEALGLRSQAYDSAMVLGRLHLENQLYDHAIIHYQEAERLAPSTSKRLSAQLSRAGALSWN
jgi:tetratricopeptide (TPR) repeat protein